MADLQGAHRGLLGKVISPGQRTSEILLLERDRREESSVFQSDRFYCP